MFESGHWSQKISLFKKNNVSKLKSKNRKYKENIKVARKAHCMVRQNLGMVAKQENKTFR